MPLELMVLNPKRRRSRRRRRVRLARDRKGRFLKRTTRAMRRVITRGNKRRNRRGRRNWLVRGNRRRRNRTGVPYSGSSYRPRKRRRPGAIAWTRKAFYR